MLCYILMQNLGLLFQLYLSKKAMWLNNITRITENIKKNSAEINKYIYMTKEQKKWEL